MKVQNLTTVLNIKIIVIVFFLMIMTTIYSHLLSLQKENEKNIQYMIAITDFIWNKKPPDVFSANGAQDAAATSPEQFEKMQRQLQPILENICMPLPRIKFGFYSKKDHKIIAIGPQFDEAMRSDLNSKQMPALHQDTTPKLVKEDSSLLWHGAEAMTYSRPIIENNVIVGHVFTTIDQTLVFSGFCQKTINMLFGTLVMLLISIVIFRELFVKLKHDLNLFAESIVAGNYDKYRSEFTEFNTALNYISEQTKKMTGLERLNIVGEMAAGIAHEIRNPMTTVRGLLQFIGNKQEFIKHKENFTLMIEELDRANKIITEFLSLSKNKALEFKEENLNTIIEDIQPLLQSNVIYNNSVLVLDLKPIPDILLDRNSIRQLILNMVKNGLDAISGSGTITIATKAINDRVILSITDSGMGIPPDIKEKLGTPFFTTKETGTGLGLAICYRIVQRHAALLTIDSQPGQGTTFNIAFKQKYMPAVLPPSENIIKKSQ